MMLIVARIHISISCYSIKFMSYVILHLILNREVNIHSERIIHKIINDNKSRTH